MTIRFLFDHAGYARDTEVNTLPTVIEDAYIALGAATRTLADAQGIFAPTDGSGAGRATSVFQTDDSGNVFMLMPDGTAVALTNMATPVNRTTTGVVAAAACEFIGFTVRSKTATPTVALYDHPSAATGTLIMTVASIAALGTYLWSGDWVTPGLGINLARINANGCWAVITGTADIDFLLG